MVQCLRHCAFNAGVPSLIPGQGTPFGEPNAVANSLHAATKDPASRMPQRRLQIHCAATKIQCS